MFEILEQILFCEKQKSFQVLASACPCTFIFTLSGCITPHLKKVAETLCSATLLLRGESAVDILSMNSHH